MENIFALPPSPTEASRPFWEGCNDKKLLLQFCRSCDRLFYYARRNCPHCGGGDLQWRAARGSGTVWSYTHVEVSFYGSQWESQIPYTSLLVDLDEGVRMLSRLVGAGRADVEIGARLCVNFVRIDSQMFPYFKLVKA